MGDTKFSHDRGFHEQPFDLVISTRTAGATIRYTTNGTPPSLGNGFTYTGPIPIRSTTVIRAAAFKTGLQPSGVDTHTYLFLADVIRQASNGAAPPGWPTSWGANVRDYGMDPDIVNSPLYRDEIVPALKSLPSFCVVTDLNHLFNSATGIYANPGQDGRDWERPISLELVHPDGREGFQVNAGIRIRGGFSRSTSNPKHALRFFFREEYGASKLQYPLFGDRGADEFDAIDLRTFQNYSWSFQGDSRGVFIRDQFSRDTQLAMGRQGERGDFYHLYINGMYWGLFQTDERIDNNYAASYLGGEPEDYDVVHNDPRNNGATDGTL
ncbi:MAG: FN3 associated domain-containing protein, partial [Phycisphaerales bacterium]